MTRATRVKKTVLHRGKRSFDNHSEGAATEKDVVLRGEREREAGAADAAAATGTTTATTTATVVMILIMVVVAGTAVTPQARQEIVVVIVASYTTISCPERVDIVAERVDIVKVTQRTTQARSRTICI